MNITELKAEAFDLLRHRETTLQKINARLEQIYAEIGNLETGNVIESEEGQE
jgi:hypothetical protein